MIEMKKLFWALSVVALIATFGCSEDEETFVEADIVGVWNVTDVSADYSVGEMSFVDYLVENLEMSELEAKAIEVGMQEGFGAEFEGVVDMKADNTYIAEFAGEDPDAGDWELVAGKTLKLLSEGEVEPTELTIVSVTSSKMVLEFDESFEEDMNQDGEAEEISALIQMTMTKQEQQ